MVSPSTAQWMCEQIIQTLSDYGYDVTHEDSVMSDKVEHFACIIVHRVTREFFLGTGKSRFAALQSAYERAGLNVYL